MTKKLRFVLIAGCCLLLSCSNNGPGSEPGNNTVQKPGIEAVLALYPNINFDTLWVTSVFEDYNDPAFPFKGTPIDTALFSLFPEPIRKLVRVDKELFACSQFVIDSSHIALITRTPSEYISSSVKLLVFNVKTKQFSDPIELSESWGDAGDSFTIDSWIYKNNRGVFECFYWQEFCTHDMESNDPETCSDSLAVYTLENGMAKAARKDAQTLERLKKAFESRQ